MELRSLLLPALLIGAAWQGWEQWQTRPFHPPEGVLAPSEPVQTDLGTGEALVSVGTSEALRHVGTGEALRQVSTGEPLRHGRWVLSPRARYDITARILGREDYRFDALADLIPEDLALGWGPMSDSRVLAEFDISQSARFYSWRPRSALPIPRETVIASSANTHVIPIDSRIREQLRRLRTGQVVHLTGYLVDAVRDDGAWIHTSLTRTDSGAGACEVMLVESIHIETQ